MYNVFGGVLVGGCCVCAHCVGVCGVVEIAAVHVLQTYSTLGRLQHAILLILLHL